MTFHRMDLDMGNLVQAAEEYLADYTFDRAVSLLSAEFNISRSYAWQVCEQVERSMLFYDGI